MITYTPGPWKATDYNENIALHAQAPHDHDGTDPYAIYIRAGRVQVAFVEKSVRDDDLQNDWANAIAIAAVPDLILALRNVVARCNVGNCNLPAEIQFEVRDALAKAGAL